MKYRLMAILTLLALVLGGCIPVVEQAQEESHVYASFYPIYALSSLVLDGVSGIRLSCLSQPQDGCLRSYELSDWDLHLLAYDASAVILGGGRLESFGDMLYSLGESGPAVINATYGCNLYNDDGIDAEATEDSSHLDGDNPHYYMSMYGAGLMVENIVQGLCALYPDKAEEISANAEEAVSRISDLKSEAEGICADVRGKKVILMNEALIYPAVEYGLEVAYWYDRESGDTLYGSGLENLLEEIEGCGAEVILIEKQAPAELIKNLENAGYHVAKIDIMSSYALDADGEGYFEAQLANARAIAQAFEPEE